MRNDTAGFHGIVVADGIGSHYRADFAAKHCTQALSDSLLLLENINQLDLPHLFRETKLSLIECAKKSDEFNLSELDIDQSLGTTLLCALDLGNEILCAYVGNGSIWHIRGDFDRFSSNRYIPWNAVNILNPHSIEVDGKAALTRFVSLSSASTEPTVVRIAKDLEGPGDILVVTTDGIHSSDQVDVGRDENGVVWSRVEECLILLYKGLSSMLEQSETKLDNSKLHAVLQEYLALLSDRGVLHDDTTLGIILSDRTLEYRNNLNLKNLGAFHR